MLSGWRSVPGVLLFDGVCNLCNGTVNFLIGRDSRRLLKFASLQSEYGQKQLERFNFPLDYRGSVILIQGDQVYTRSDAVFRCTRVLDFPWWLLSVFQVFPKFVRDAVYNLIGHNRYAIFGKSETCRVPTREERERFLQVRACFFPFFVLFFLFLFVVMSQISPVVSVPKRLASLGLLFFSRVPAGFRKGDIKLEALGKANVQHQRCEP